MIALEKRVQATKFRRDQRSVFAGVARAESRSQSPFFRLDHFGRRLIDGPV